MSTLQYKRKISLIVGGASGKGLEFSDFRINFAIHRGDSQTPNSADIRIWNISDATASQILAGSDSSSGPGNSSSSGEFTQVALQAGYESTGIALIFFGTIKQFRLGRESAKDSYLDITAADGDEVYNFATVSQTLAAGSASNDAGTIRGILRLMFKNATGSPNGMDEKGAPIKSGITSASIPADLDPKGRLRGKVLYGLARDELRSFTQGRNMQWSIQDGRLVLIKSNSYIPGEEPVISAATGMIGVPEQTQDGIHIKILLNPAIKIGSTIKLETNAVNQLRFNLDIDAAVINPRTRKLVGLDPGGRYYVMRADHSGDTRGNEWYTDLTCLSLGAADQEGVYTEVVISPQSFIPYNASGPAVTGP